MSRRAGLWLLALAAARVAAAQAISPGVAVERAESLRAAGRPWHAAETLLAAAARDPSRDPAFIVEAARAELRARRYDRARSLLAGQPWLEDYQLGDALAILAEAEVHLGLPAAAAPRFVLAAARNTGSRAAVLTVRAALAFDAAGLPDSAVHYYAAARPAVPIIDAWLRLRQAQVTADTAAAARLLGDLPWAAAREVPVVRARVLLGAGDTAAAILAFEQAGRRLDAARLSVAHGDSDRARTDLYDLMARAPESDDAAAGVTLARGPLPPRLPAERVALGHVFRLHGDPLAARAEVSRAVAPGGGGDSSAATLVFLGELLNATGRPADAERVYRAAARDSVWGALATYRRARVLVRLDDPGATEALAGFAQKYPSDTAAPSALFLIGDHLSDHSDWTGAGRWFGELIARYPTDLRASLARFRLAARAVQAGAPDSAARIYQSEVDAGGSQRLAARFWLGRLARQRGDSAKARALWTALAHDDSTGYYGLRVRRELGMPLPRFAATAPAPVPEEVARALATMDTLTLAGLDSEAQLEVRAALTHPPQTPDGILALSEGLATRGWGPAGVRLGWLAATRVPIDTRVLRAIYPWPDRAALEAEAQEFGVDPWLFVALVRQESVFDLEALSTAGARGLAQLLPGTAAQTARTLDVTFYPEWITVPDLNLHLGAAHLLDLLHRFQGRADAAVAAYNAGTVPVTRWLTRPGADDPDQFLELIPFQETRGYVRGVFRNRDLYRALYGSPNH